MQGWKKAVIIGTLGAGALAFVTGRRPVGVALASVGLAVLASEYPEAFEEAFEHGPEYLNRGVQIFSTLSQIVERLAEEAARRTAVTYREVSPEYRQ